MENKNKQRLSPLEIRVMNIVWENERTTAEDVRAALSTRSQTMKDATARTILRRLEEKGYVAHSVEGRTYVYSATVESRNVATEAVRGIIDRFCSGSVENLLVGMVKDDVVSAEKLKDLAARIAKSEPRKNKGSE